MMLGILAAGAAYWLMMQLTKPSYKHCPAGRLKRLRKRQARARRILRDPKHRGNRAMHRAARRLMALTRKSHGKTPTWRPLSSEDAKLLGICMGDKL